MRIAHSSQPAVADLTEGCESIVAKKTGRARFITASLAFCAWHHAGGTLKRLQALLEALQLLLQLWWHSSASTGLCCTQRACLLRACADSVLERAEASLHIDLAVV